MNVHVIIECVLIAGLSQHSCNNIIVVIRTHVAGNGLERSCHESYDRGMNVEGGCIANIGFEPNSNRA